MRHFLTSLIVATAACAHTPDPKECATGIFDENLRQLALSLNPDSVRADERAYARVVRDVRAIRALDPAMKRIGYFPKDDGRTLILMADAKTLAAMRDGTYHAWDELNREYGNSAVNVADGMVSLRFPWPLNFAALGKLYRKLPGITDASANSLSGGGPTISIKREENVWTYFFDDASGDCPAGCINSDVTVFKVDGDKPPVFVRHWSSKDGTPRPN